MGYFPVTNLDNSDNIILDPKTADRGEYTNFIGYFAVKAVAGGIQETALASIPADSTTDRVLISLGEQNPVISIEQIGFIQKGMSGDEVRRRIGLPQDLYGSGIVMDSYLLDNVNKLIISYGPMRNAVQKVFVLNNDGEYNFIIE